MIVVSWVVGVELNGALSEARWNLDVESDLAQFQGGSDWFVKLAIVTWSGGFGCGRGSSAPF